MSHTKFNSTVKAEAEEDIFSELKVHIDNIGLTHVFEPYKVYNSIKICFEISGTIEQHNRLNKQWADIEARDKALPIQYTTTLWDRIILSLGKKFNIGMLPIAKITNKGKTEIYTLLKNGFVVIQGINGGSRDAIPVNMCNEKVIKAFEVALIK